jgi:hypothetical protein
MNSYQPQQQQPQYRPNRAALWVNARKTAANQPDYKGNLEISYALLQELMAAFNSGQYEQDRGGQPCIKLDIALYAQQGGVSASGRSKPILSGQLSSLAETQQSAASRQQAQAGQQQPQGYAPAPVPAAPQPQYQPAPQGYAQPPQGYAPAPQPAPQPQYQQPPQPQYAPQPPQAPPEQPQQFAQPPMPQPPMAPPMPAQPMPGAIHGQPPAAPAPTLPQGF